MLNKKPVTSLTIYLENQLPYSKTLTTRTIYLGKKMPHERNNTTLFI